MLRKTASTVVLLSALGLTRQARSEDVPRFPHDVHVKENDLKCEACHKTQEGAFPQLDKTACNDCHDGAPTYTFAPKARRLWAKFPHSTHEDVAGCQDCHDAILTTDWTRGGPMFAQSQCTACHADSSVNIPPQACSRCHGQDARKARPANHDSNWTRLHFMAAEGRMFAPHGQDCAMCHGNDACVRCHNERAPASHNALWRLRTHGLAAGWDRDRCKTCHQTNQCIRCHETNPPLNHSGSWLAMHGLTAGFESNSTCLTCHRSTQCASCHRGGN